MDDLISRAEAIDALKRKQDDGKGDLSRFYNTIIQHDIEAIMQLPPIQPDNCSEFPNNSDAISRQKAIDALTEYGNGRAVFISVGEAVIRIEQLPPIQPEPQYKTNYGFMWLCPKCGLPIHSDYTRCVRCGHNREKGV